MANPLSLGPGESAKLQSQENSMQSMRWQTLHTRA
jgi:hypothetical protein